jgi:hypothetical protein
MNELDSFLLKSILHSIKNEFGFDRVNDLVIKLQQEHSLEFSDWFSKYDKVKKSLVEFETELINIEDKVLRNFLTIEKSTVASTGWLVIKNKRSTELILKTFADEDKKLILDLLTIKTETIPNILESCGLPNTSTYRKINQLINDGFVMPVGLAESFEGKRAILYKTIIKEIQIIINKNSIVAKILVPDDLLRSSLIIKTIVEINQNKSNALAS